MKLSKKLQIDPIIENPEELMFMKSAKEKLSFSNTFNVK